MRVRLALVALALLLPADVLAEAGSLRLLAQAGAVGLLRHARAPGSGDPPGMRLDDCGTQRNLSEDGRVQARNAGARLRAAGLGEVRVHASAWCRAMETAALLGLGAVEPLPALNSIFAGGQGDRRRQTTELRAFLEVGRTGPVRILVTHQVNVAALTGLRPADAEMVILHPAREGYDVVGRVRLD